jgi:hypothetical protein
MRAAVLSKESEVMSATAVSIATRPWRPASSMPRLAMHRAESRVLIERIPGGRHGHRDQLACDTGAWALLLEVGRAFGWHQLGTTYVRSGPRSVTAPSNDATRHDYVPGDARDRKLVDAGDAIAWSLALSAAQRSPYLPGMLGAAPLRSSFDAVIESFARYSIGGAFTFARIEEI